MTKIGTKEGMNECFLYIIIGFTQKLVGLQKTTYRLPCRCCRRRFLEAGGLLVSSPSSLGLSG